MSVRPAMAFVLVLLVCWSSKSVCSGQSTRTTVAVMDFINRRPGDEYDWLAKGLADMVITDLSASPRLNVVDRQRIQQLAREFDLAALGLLERETAPVVGRVAKADWVFQGTFACERGEITLEAVLIDARGQRAIRIDRITGPLNEVFTLENRLVTGVLENMNASMSSAEFRRVKLLKTNSLSAFEHYSRSLSRFDRGQWYSALEEARLAKRADRGYLLAAARVAQLYREVGESEHALVEYQRLADQDTENVLPEEIYFQMAVVLDEATADRDAAAGILRRITDRYRDTLPSFDVTVPSRLARGWDDVGGKSTVDRIVASNSTRLRTLMRLARWQEEGGNQFEAAKIRSRVRHFLFSHGMPYGDPGLNFGPSAHHAYATDNGYWEAVRHNQDRSLYPGTVAVIRHNETVDATTTPTHGRFEWSSSRIWLAPPDFEFAKILYRVGGVGTAEQLDFSGPNGGNQPMPRGRNGDGSRAADPAAGESTASELVQVDIASADGAHSQLFEMVKVQPDGKWHEMEFETGIRALRTHVFHDDRWQMRFELRRWNRPAEVPKIGSFQVNVLPGGAEVIRNGKSYGRIKQGIAFVRIPTGEYTVEARWPDGRCRTHVVNVKQGQRTQFSLNADVKTESRVIVADRGSNLGLLNDRHDRFWLVWDELQGPRLADFNKESDIYCSTSRDGRRWSRPRRLPISSLACDFKPILRQDRLGIYHLVWISERGPRPEKNIWIASSFNGVEWSFPRKIHLPAEAAATLRAWQSTRVASIAFAIDTRNTFHLLWNGWHLSSDDSKNWVLVGAIKTGAKSSDHVDAGRHYDLSCRMDGRLVLLASEYGVPYGSRLWLGGSDGKWTPIARLTDQHVRYVGNAASLDGGALVAVAPRGSDLHVHQISGDGTIQTTVPVETYLTLPYHGAIVPFSKDRWLVAFGSTQGIVAAEFHKEAVFTRTAKD